MNAIFNHDFIFYNFLGVEYISSYKPHFYRMYGKFYTATQSFV